MWQKAKVIKYLEDEVPMEKECWVEGPPCLVRAGIDHKNGNFTSPEVKNVQYGNFKIYCFLWSR